MGREPLVFLSHSGADTEDARKLKGLLLASPDAQKAGLKVWSDKDPGILEGVTRYPLTFDPPYVCLTDPPPPPDPAAEAR